MIDFPGRFHWAQGEVRDIANAAGVVVDRCMSLPGSGPAPGQAIAFGRMRVRVIPDPGYVMLDALGKANGTSAFQRKVK